RHGAQTQQPVEATEASRSLALPGDASPRSGARMGPDRSDPDRPVLNDELHRIRHEAQRSVLGDKAALEEHQLVYANTPRTAEDRASWEAPLARFVPI